MLKQRLISSFLALPALVAIVWMGDPWFTILAGIWGLLAAFEFYQLVTRAKSAPLTIFGLAWVLLFILSPYYNYGFTVPLLLSLAVIIPLLWFLARPRKEGAFNDWSWTVAGIFYVGWLLSYYVLLRNGAVSSEAAGRNWVYFAFFATFASDSAAFLVGRAVGKHPLAPRISPRKTWEGAVAGVLGAVAVSFVFTAPHIFNFANPLFVARLSYWQSILLGILVSIFGQLGDLAESLFKRNMGVKESGRGLPGHGGFLDRTDSILFAGVVVYYYVMLVVR
jgi:phosphatidate cytidylyltransferase